VDARGATTAAAAATSVSPSPRLTKEAIEEKPLKKKINTEFEVKRRVKLPREAATRKRKITIEEFGGGDEDDGSDEEYQDFATDDGSDEEYQDSTNNNNNTSSTRKKRKITVGEFEFGDEDDGWDEEYQDSTNSNNNASSAETADNDDDNSREFYKHDRRWENHFRSLLDYKERYGGSTAVPQTYKTKPELGIWVHRQRTKYFDGSLSQNRKERLNAIGFVWQVTKFVPWETMYQRLVEYKERFGTTQVPRLYKENPALGYWVYNQRQKCKKEERRRKLKSIGFVWCVKRKRKGASKNCESLEQLRNAV